MRGGVTGLVIALAVPALANVVKEIAVVGPFTEGQVEYEQPIGYLELIAALVGARHCETRDGRFVDEVADFATDCPGLSFKFVATDSQGDASVMTQTFVDHFADTIDYVVGASYSSVTKPLAMISGALDTPVTSYWATSPDLSDRGSYSHFTRVIPSDFETTRMMASLMHTYDLSHVGMLYADDSYGNAYRDAFLDATSDLGIELISQGYRVGQEAKSVPLALEQLRKAGVNVIVAVVIYDSLIPLMEFMVETPDMMGPGKLLVFTDGVSAGTINQAITDSGDPQKVRAVFENQQILQASGGNDQSQRFLNFSAGWLDLANDQGMVDYLNSRLPGGIDYIQARNASLDINVTSTVFAATHENVDTVAPYAYDASISACRAMCLAHKNKGADFTGADVVEALFSEEFKFNGVSGRIDLSPETGSRRGSSTNYQMFSLLWNDDVDGFVSTRKGSLDQNGDWTIAPDTVFPGKVQSFPTTTDVQEENLNQIPIGLKITGWVIMGLIILLCLYFISWTILNRRSKQVIKSQPQFLIIFLFGTIISTLSIYFLSVDDGAPDNTARANFACNASWAFWSLGSTTVTAALLVKLYRILKIFNNPSLRTLKISNCDLYRKILMLLVVDVVILVAWYTSRPMSWVRYGHGDRDAEEDQDADLITLDSFGNVVESYGVCTTTTGKSASPFQILLLVYNFGLFAVAAVICYKVRHVDSDFQESAYFFVAMFSQLQLYALGVPVILAIGEASTSVRFLIFTILIAVNNLVLVLLLMVPKVSNIDMLSAFGNSGSNNGTANATAGGERRTSANSMTKYNKTKEDIYTIHDDEDIDFDEVLKLQRPSITFDEMYGAPTTTAVVVDENEDGSEKQAKRTSIVVA